MECACFSDTTNKLAATMDWTTVFSIKKWIGEREKQEWLEKEKLT